MFDDLITRAARLAQHPFYAINSPLPAPFANLNYDEYRKLRPRPETALWSDEDHGYAVLPLPSGYLFPDSVSLSFIERGAQRSLTSASRFVDFVDYPAATARDRADLGISGWRLLRRSVSSGFQEAAVFQGGAYFRAVANDLQYGISARGLALNTGAKEEFPAFREFQLLEPSSKGHPLTTLGLLDSPSLAGAYRFDIEYGAATTIDVAVALFPRVDMTEFGLAPMSSMFAHGAADPAGANVRPEVHDSDGLCIRTRRGEQMWRPLRNSHTSRVSAFHEKDPVGFGLLQRERHPTAYRDAEARYETRPSLWVEPQGDWGAGDILLIEFPTTNEYNDNIVAYWRPDAPLRARVRRDFQYRLVWNAAGPQTIGRILRTNLNSSRFSIDFDHAHAPGDDANLWASAGAVTNLSTERAGPLETRLSFNLDPGDAKLVELRANLKRPDGRPTSETWLYQWTPD